MANLRIAAQSLMNALPYREKLSKEVITKTLDYIELRDPSRLLWHIQRFYGFGCSELGGLVADFRNLQKNSHESFEHSFSNAKDIIDSKLLRNFTLLDNGNVNRGSEFEEIIRSRCLKQFRSQYDPKCYRDLDAIAIMADLTSKTNKEHPWLTGNIDDIFVIKGKRYIVDYKFPQPGQAIKPSQEGVLLDYRVQLEGYGQIAKEELIIDGFILAPFDFQKYKTYPVFFNSDPKLVEDIYAAGDHYWSMLLKGRSPNYVTKYKTKADPKMITDNMYALANKIGVLSQMKKEIEQELFRSQEHLRKELSHNKYEPDTRIELGIVNASTKKVVDYDVQYLLDSLRDCNVDVSDCVVSTKINYDHEKLFDKAQKVVEQGYAVDLTEARVISDKLSVTVSRVTKGVRAEIIKGVKEAAIDSINSHIKTTTADVNELTPSIKKELTRSYDNFRKYNSEYEKKQLVNENKSVNESAINTISSINNWF